MLNNSNGLSTRHSRFYLTTITIKSQYFLNIGFIFNYLSVFFIELFFYKFVKDTLL